MKLLLTLSLCLNALLLYRVLTQKEEVVVQEKVVVKRVKPEVIERKVYVEVPVKAKKSPEEGPKVTSVEFDEKDMEDLVSKVAQDRDDYLTGELGFTPSDYQKVQKVKEAFHKKYQQIIPPNHFGDLTIEQRRQLLALDEERDQEMARVVGEKKWKQFQKFRDEYNRKMLSKQVSEKGIIIPMEI